ncbi:MAG: T9SS type A sorting domain-containing protein [Algicola sp.]|nr:T9SS type A sorting domain-containing protein [Algicola sp.]
MKKKLLTLLLLVVFQFTFGQISFYETVIDSTNPISIRYTNNFNNFTYTGDLNGDGNQDLVLQSNPLIWIENASASGDFNITHMVDANMNAQEIRLLDFDTAGDLDIVALGSYNNNPGLVWYENIDGLGNFSSLQLTVDVTNIGISRMEVKDLDGDSDLDIIIASTGNTKISWYENTGDEIFADEQVIINEASLDNMFKFMVVDFDNDNDNDIVYGIRGLDNTLHLLENIDGLGNFNSPELLLTHTDSLFINYFFDLKDVNNDGVLDVFIGDYNNLILYYNDGQGNLNFETSFNGSYDYFSGYSKLIDLDGDSDLDVLCFVGNDNDSNEGVIVWYENTDGAGTFGTEQFLKNIHFTDSRFDFDVLDLNSDGYIDIVCKGLDGFDLSWNERETTSLAFSDSKKIINDLEGVSNILSVDIDSDGDKDIVFVSPDIDKLGWYENLDGDGTLSEQKIISLEGNGFREVKAVDIDNNNTIDLIAESSEDNNVWVYKNTDGLGNFVLHQTITNSTASSRNIKVFDVDNDGDDDIVNLQNYNDELVWFENIDGLGNFGTEQIITNEIDNLDDYQFSDLDNDGDIDIVLTNPFSWLENLGGGSFGSPQVISNESISRIKIFDIDSDGDNDIFVRYNGWFIGWYDNTDSQGNFSDFILIDEISSRRELIVDVNNDNNLDLIIERYINSEESFLYLFKNYEGTFTSPPVMIFDENVDQFSDMVASDLDGNNSQDIIYATSISSGYAGKIGWFRNLEILDNQISGSVIYDDDNNGCTTNDLSVGNTLIYTYGNGYSLSTFTEDDGTFLLNVGQDEYQTYLVPTTLEDYFNWSPESYFTEFVNSGEVDDTVNFCMTAPSSKNDLNLSIYPLNDPRPGFDIAYKIVYNNVGTTQLSGDITLTFDDTKIQFLNASETVAQQTANTLTFNYSNLNPFETRTIDLNFNVFSPPTTNIDDNLITTATINPTTGDETVTDNTFELQQTVIGSYDPNDIQVLEGHEISINEVDNYLHYIIRFQNTGTASAINVNIEHILDTKLTWYTMRLESMSHSGRVEIIDGIQVKFIFDNIHLPDSTTDEPNSHGYVAFKIKPVNGAQVGDVINGSAKIYFDYNPAIITNTVSTEIIEALSVNEFNNTNKIIAFPNPTNQILHVKTKSSINNIKVYDLNGRLLKVKPEMMVNKNHYELDVSNLSNGIYFLDVRLENFKQTIKFIKE